MQQVKELENALINAVDCVASYVALSGALKSELQKAGTVIKAQDALIEQLQARIETQSELIQELLKELARGQE